MCKRWLLAQTIVSLERQLWRITANFCWYEIRVRGTSIRSDFPPASPFNMLDPKRWQPRIVTKKIYSLSRLQNPIWQIRSRPLPIIRKRVTTWQNHRGIHWSNSRTSSTGSKTITISMEVIEKLHTPTLDPLCQCYIGTTSPSTFGPIFCLGCYAYPSVPFYTAFSSHDMN